MEKALKESENDAKKEGDFFTNMEKVKEQSAFEARPSQKVLQESEIEARKEHEFLTKIQGPLLKSLEEQKRDI